MEYTYKACSKERSHQRAVQVLGVAEQVQRAERVTFRLHLFADCSFAIWRRLASMATSAWRYPSKARSRAAIQSDAAGDA